MRQTGSRARRLADHVLSQRSADGQRGAGGGKAHTGHDHGRLDIALHARVDDQRIAAIAADAGAIDQRGRRRADQVKSIGAASCQRRAAQTGADADRHGHGHRGDPRLAVRLDRHRRRADQTHPVHSGQGGVVDLVLRQRSRNRQSRREAQRQSRRDRHGGNRAVDGRLIQGFDRHAARLERQGLALVADTGNDAGLYFVDRARAGARA